MTTSKSDHPKSTPVKETSARERQEEVDKLEEKKEEEAEVDPKEAKEHLALQTDKEAALSGLTQSEQQYATSKEAIILTIASTTGGDFEEAEKRFESGEGLEEFGISKPYHL
jgi:hypothetical protein